MRLDVLIKEKECSISSVVRSQFPRVTLLVIPLERLITVNRYVDPISVMVDSRVVRRQTHCACAVMLSLLKYQSLVAIENRNVQQY